jgi:hypothetical protein
MAPILSRLSSLGGGGIGGFSFGKKQVASGAAAAVIYATGGTKTFSSSYTIHTFTSSGDFTVSEGSGNVEYLVVAGGGAGGHDVGGGGGAGGFRTNVSGHPLASPSPFPVSPGPYAVTVGAGGVATPGVPTPAATNGGNSVFSTITSTGGGGGGNYNGGYGLPGGSGGGGSSYTGSYPGGTGNSPPTSPPQGNPGGAGSGAGTSGQGGGGGGAGGSGPGGGSGSSGFTPGGVGSPISITGTAVTYAAGGRGGGDTAPGPAAGNPGTGDGGDGAGTVGPSGSNGGSGIVIIRYSTSVAVQYRYWRIYKTDGAVGGPWTNEVQWTLQGSATYYQGSNYQNWTGSGLNSFNAAAVTDGNTGGNAFHTDTAGVGSYALLDLGAGNAKYFNKVEFWMASSGVTSTWNIQASNDLSSWTTFYTGLNVYSYTNISVTW